MKKYYVTTEEVIARVQTLSPHFSNKDKIYGVPRGGVPVALCMSVCYGCSITDNVEEATIIVDDLIDSGKTRDYYRLMFPQCNFVALFDKRFGDSTLPWLSFPWEENNSDSGDERSAEDIFVRLLQYIGEDPKREGLKDTPKRMAKAWKEWTAGYQMNPRDFLTVFKDDTQRYDQIILLKNIPFYSHCCHHLAIIQGTASIGYIPQDGVVIGISKLARILDMYARRLTIQEEMTKNIADCIEQLLKPQGVAVVVEAVHACTTTRGVNKQGQSMVTSAMRGVFLEKQSARLEFMELLK